MRPNRKQLSWLLAGLFLFALGTLILANTSARPASQSVPTKASNWFQRPASRGQDAQHASRTSFLPKTLHSVTTSVKSVPLVAGCGRSGTMSTRTFLEKVGIDTVHENVLPGNVTVSWVHTPANLETRNFPGWVGRKDVRHKLQRQLMDAGLPLFSPVVHVVRHPLKGISSTRRCFCGSGDRFKGNEHHFHILSWRFVDDVLNMPPAAQDYDSVLRSMIYWYEWNKNVPVWHDGRVTERFRVEDINPRRLLTALRIPLTEELEQRVTKYLGSDQDRLPNDPQHKSRDHAKVAFPDVDWLDLLEADADLTRLIWKQAQEYGYEVGRTLEQALAQDLLTRAYNAVVEAAETQADGFLQAMQSSHDKEKQNVIERLQNALSSDPDLQKQVFELLQVPARKLEVSLNSLVVQFAEHVAEMIGVSTQELKLSIRNTMQQASSSLRLPDHKSPR